MNVVLAGLVITGLIPLSLAFSANRRTSLAHALLWAMLAWASWALTIFLDESELHPLQPARYAAFCLTGCAGVAVLGARRPQVGAWNFVVGGLFAVMLWPLVETQLLGTRSTEGLRAFFLAATVAVGMLNYLPTRLAPAALMLLVVCEFELLIPFGPSVLEGSAARFLWDALLATAPWLGWLCWRRRNDERSAFDRVWLDFRDRWGLVWSQRVREQFNHAAQNAAWPVKLSWRGLVLRSGESRPSVEDREKYLDVLRATLQRFLDADPHR